MTRSHRIHYIDNIKIAITFLVVAHHAGQAYGNTGGVWPIADPPMLGFLPSFFYLNAAYMMGFFFFVSGYFMYFSVAKKSTAAFLQDRFRRLGIPLLFFSLFVFVPINYLMAEKPGDYLSFMYDNYMHHPPLAVGHLWFVASLLAYTFVFFAIKKPLLAGAEWKWQSYYPLLYIVVLSVINYFVRLEYPIDHWETWFIPIEVAHLPQYLSLFLLGVVAHKNRWLDQITLSQGLIYFFFGIGLFSVRSLFPASIPYRYVEPVVETFLCIGMIMGSLVIFRQLANRTAPLLQFFSDCSYGIYLFHLFLVIAFQILLCELAIPTGIKFGLVTLFGIGAAAGLTYGLRRIRLLSRIL